MSNKINIKIFFISPTSEDIDKWIKINEWKNSVETRWNHWEIINEIKVFLKEVEPKKWTHIEIQHVQWDSKQSKKRMNSQTNHLSWMTINSTLILNENWKCSFYNICQTE